MAAPISAYFFVADENLALSIKARYHVDAIMTTTNERFVRAAMKDGMRPGDVVVYDASLFPEWDTDPPVHDERVRMVALGLGSLPLCSKPDEVAVAMGAERRPREHSQVIGLISPWCGGMGKTTFGGNYVKIASAQEPAIIVDFTPLGGKLRRWQGAPPDKDQKGVYELIRARRYGEPDLDEFIYKEAGIHALLAPGVPRDDIAEIVTPSDAISLIMYLRREYDTIVLDFGEPDEIVGALLRHMDVAALVVDARSDNALAWGGIVVQDLRPRLGTDQKPDRENIVAVVVNHGSAADGPAIAKRLDASVVGVIPDDARIPRAELDNRFIVDERQAAGLADAWKRTYDAIAGRRVVGVTA
ncbi:MAG: hypothetical protein ACYDAG_00485 [Chloroflexota bacterium]